LRRFLIQRILPLLFCLVPMFAAALVGVCIPPKARDFYLTHLTLLDGLILLLGGVLFVLQTSLAWVALQWRSTGFDERPDKALSNLAQVAEWFPLLGLLGTVAGILQTFSSLGDLSRTVPATTQEIMGLYAPAITATGSGLFMALFNILPTWIVISGRDLLRTLGGETPAVADSQKSTTSP
jgi:hypothetical protein